MSIQVRLCFEMSVAVIKFLAAPGKSVCIDCVCIVYAELLLMVLLSALTVCASCKPSCR